MPSRYSPRSEDDEEPGYYVDSRGRKRRYRKWSDFEMRTLYSLIVKGMHNRIVDPKKADRSRRDKYMDLATALNTALHKDDLSRDIDVRDVGNMVQYILDNNKGGLAFLEQNKAGRLTRTLWGVFERNYKFTGSIQEWEEGRKQEVMGKPKPKYNPRERDMGTLRAPRDVYGRPIHNFGYGHGSSFAPGRRRPMRSMNMAAIPSSRGANKTVHGHNSNGSVGEGPSVQNSQLPVENVNWADVLEAQDFAPALARPPPATRPRAWFPERDDDEEENEFFQSRTNTRTASHAALEEGEVDDEDDFAPPSPVFGSQSPAYSPPMNNPLYENAQHSMGGPNAAAALVQDRINQASRNGPVHPGSVDPHGLSSSAPSGPNSSYPPWNNHGNFRPGFHSVNNHTAGYGHGYGGGGPSHIRPSHNGFNPAASSYPNPVTLDYGTPPDWSQPISNPYTGHGHASQSMYQAPNNQTAYSNPPQSNYPAAYGGSTASGSNFGEYQAPSNRATYGNSTASGSNIGDYNNGYGHDYGNNAQRPGPAPMVPGSGAPNWAPGPASHSYDAGASNPGHQSHQSQHVAQSEAGSRRDLHTSGFVIHSEDGAADSEPELPPMSPTPPQINQNDGTSDELLRRFNPPFLKMGSRKNKIGVETRRPMTSRLPSSGLMGPAAILSHPPIPSAQDNKENVEHTFDHNGPPMNRVRGRGGGSMDLWGGEDEDQDMSYL